MMDRRYKAALDAAHLEYEAAMKTARQFLDQRLAAIRKLEDEAISVFESLRKEAEAKEEAAMLAAIRETRPVDKIIRRRSRTISGEIAFRESAE